MCMSSASSAASGPSAAPDRRRPLREMNGVNLLVQLLEDGGESADHVEISLHSQPPEADFAAPSSDDVDELGRSRGSQMTSHTRSIGHGRRERVGGRWKQHGAPLDAFSRLACQE